MFWLKWMPKRLAILTSATQAASEPCPGPAQSALQWMVEQFGAGPVPLEPPPRLRPELELPEDDPAAHWELAQQLRHCTVARRPQLDSCRCSGGPK